MYPFCRWCPSVSDWISVLYSCCGTCGYTVQKHFTWWWLCAVRLTESSCRRLCRLLCRTLYLAGFLFLSFQYLGFIYKLFHYEMHYGYHEPLNRCYKQLSSFALCTLYQGGITPLHLAAQRGSKEAISLLLDRGADIEAKIDVRRTPVTLCWYLDDWRCT